MSKRSDCRCDCSPYCDCPCHAAVDLQQEAREWREAHATEFWKMSDNGMEFDLDAMLAAFAAHLRGK